MHGIYSWNAGAAAAHVVADLVAIASGAANAAGLSASCNKQATVISGAPGAWSVIDATYGMISHPGIAGGPGMEARLSISAAGKVALQVVNQWAVATHAAAFAYPALDASLVIAQAGSVNLIVTPDAFMVAASDWSAWVLVSEVKRDSPVMSGDAPGTFTLSGLHTCGMPRVKQPAGVGDAAGASVQVQSAYGALSAVAARNRAESLYFPMVPAVLTYGAVPVGEAAGVLAVGGYAASGDVVLDAAAAEYRVLKTQNNLLVAVKQV